MKSLTNNNIIMCGHNNKAFDCVHFLNALVLIKVHITEFHKVIFADTLRFYGLSTDRYLCRKENKLKHMYSQETLFHDIVGGRGGGVLHGPPMQSAMFNHYNQLSQNVTKSVYCRITIHLHSCPQLRIILMKRNDNSGTFRAITTEKCTSHQMAKKCAGSGLFMHLQLAFQRDGVHEFDDVLSEEINNKPRVTKHKIVIAKQKIAISNTNYF